MWKLGSLEAEVMERLWAAEAALPVRKVVDDVNEGRGRALAYTTVMTTMTRLHDKGWLRRRRSGKQFLYEPTSTRDACTAATMADVFSGSSNPESALLHVVEHVTESGTPELQAALRRVLNGDS